MKETFRDVIRVFILVDVLVMAAVLATPKKRGILKCAGTKDQREKSDNRMGVECEMRQEPVIAERDRKATRSQHDEKQSDLEPIDAKMPDVEWDRSKG